MKKIKKLTPAHERVLVKVEEPETMTEGGLIIPEDAKEPPVVGTVIAMGELVTKNISHLKEGDQVMFLKYAGMPVNLENEELKLIMANDIIGVVEY